MIRGRAVSLIVYFWPLLLVAAALVPRQDAATAQPVPAPTSAPPPPPPQSCPVTLPTSDPPPGYRESSEPSYYGNGALWTLLWPNGRVVFASDGPGFVLADGSLGMKWPWIPAVPGELAVEGRRLDGQAPPLWADIGEGFTEQGRFFPTYLNFPTPGCWEVTGRVGETSLTFVTLVVKIGEGPNWRPAVTHAPVSDAVVVAVPGGLLVVDPASGATRSRLETGDGIVGVVATGGMPYASVAVPDGSGTAIYAVPVSGDQPEMIGRVPGRALVKAVAADRTDLILVELPAPAAEARTWRGPVISGVMGRSSGHLAPRSP